VKKAAKRRCSPEIAESAHGFTGHVRRVWIDGRAWTVYERALPPFLAGKGSHIFNSVRIVRRVRTYAANWYLLSGTELADVGCSR
jgi:uncharacterized protein YvpB